MNKVRCVDFWDADENSKMFTDNVREYYCPDFIAMQEVSLQNYSPSNYLNSTSDFYFVVDTCAHLANLTGVTDCKSESESQAVLEKMYVYTKIVTQFWNSKNFLRNGHEMNTEFTPQRTQLTGAVFQRSAYYMIQNKITFRNNRFFNAAYLPKLDPGQAFSAYDVSSSQNTIFPVTDEYKSIEISRDVNPQDSYFSIRFQ